MQFLGDSFIYMVKLSDPKTCIRYTDYIRNGVRFVRNTIFPGNMKLARLMISPLPSMRSTYKLLTSLKSQPI